MNNLPFIQLFDPTPFSCQNWPIRDREGCTVGQFSQIFTCFSLIYQQKSLKIGQNVYLDQLNQSYYCNFFMPKQANIWQQRQWRGSIFVDFCLFLSHLLTEVPENWSKCVFWLAQPIILLQLFDKTPFSCQSKNLQKLTHCAALSVTYWPVLAWKWGRIKNLNKS